MIEWKAMNGYSMVQIFITDNIDIELILSNQFDKRTGKTDPRFSIVSGRSLKICPIDSVDGPPPNAHLL